MEEKKGERKRGHSSKTVCYLQQKLWPKNKRDAVIENIIAKRRLGQYFELPWFSKVAKTVTQIYLVGFYGF